MKLDRNYDGNSDEQNHNRRGHIFLPICLNKGLEIQTLKDEWVSLFDIMDLPKTHWTLVALGIKYSYSFQRWVRQFYKHLTSRTSLYYISRVLVFTGPEELIKLITFFDKIFQGRRYIEQTCLWSQLNGWMWLLFRLLVMEPQSLKETDSRECQRSDLLQFSLCQHKPSLFFVLLPSQATAIPTINISKPQICSHDR